MEQIVHNTTWVDTDSHKMREHSSMRCINSAGGLGEELKNKLVDGVDEELDGRDPAAIAKQRDEMLLELIELKQRYDMLR